MTTRETADPYFDNVPDYSPARLEFVVPHLAELGTRPSVVDVGCGTGTALRFLRDSDAAGDLTGIDSSGPSLAVARSRVEMQSIQASILDEGALDDERGRYDAAMMAAVLHHVVGPTRSSSVANARTALLNTSRLVRGGGRIFVFEPCHGPRQAMFAIFWFKRLLISLGFRHRPFPKYGWINPGPPLVSYLTLSQLDQIVAESGLKVEQRLVLMERRLGGLISKTGIGLVLAVP